MHGVLCRHSADGPLRPSLGGHRWGQVLGGWGWGQMSRQERCVGQINASGHHRDTERAPSLPSIPAQPHLEASTWYGMTRGGLVDPYYEDNKNLQN